MSAQQIKIINKTNTKIENRVSSISYKFLNYLHEIMNEETLNKYHDDPNFSKIIKFIETFDKETFQLLVDLSVNYLSTSIITILSDFSQYLRNYNIKLE